MSDKQNISPLSPLIMLALNLSSKMCQGFIKHVWQCVVYKCTIHTHTHVFKKGREKQKTSAFNSASCTYPFYGNTDNSLVCIFLPHFILCFVSKGNVPVSVTWQLPWKMFIKDLSIYLTNLLKYFVKNTKLCFQLLYIISAGQRNFNRN